MMFFPLADRLLSFWSNIFQKGKHFSDIFAKRLVSHGYLPFFKEATIYPRAGPPLCKQFAHIRPDGQKFNAGNSVFKFHSPPRRCQKIGIFPVA